MHALRHHFASTLLHAGESIKALAEYLGHQDPGYTLRTYTHLMAGSEDRTRKAIDMAFGEVDKPHANGFRRVLFTWSRRQKAVGDEQHCRLTSASARRESPRLGTVSGRPNSDRTGH
ncbi:tyrosine-type recombinase/integrase [Sinosporangium album]|nr:tyrosine-type recombinase/integrase [Sinosporangium album]